MSLPLLAGTLIAAAVFGSDLLVFLLATTAIYAIAALSVTILTGYAGQISLATHAFMALGGFLTGIWMQRSSLPWLVALALAVAASVPVSLLVGLPALRLRGLQLAIATLAFAVAMDRHFLRFWVPKLIGEGFGGGTALRVQIRRPELGGVSFVDDRAFFVLVVGMWALATAGVFWIGRSWTGRALAAVRQDEAAAAGLGVNVARQKLLAFALSGAYATLAGGLLATLLNVADVGTYTFFLTVNVIAMAVLGGVFTPWGAALGAVLLGLGPELPLRIPVLRDVEGLSLYVPLLGAAGVIALVLTEPRGLAAALREGMAGRLRLTPEPAVAVAVARDTAPPGSDRGRTYRVAGTGDGAGSTGPLLGAEGITVRFGGLAALDDVSLSVEAGSITGLIGPNGAGKTTLFNCITGFVAPVAGTVRFGGKDLRGLRPHARARLGIARTFQTSRLLDDMSVLDNLVLAQNAHRRAPPRPRRLPVQVARDRALALLDEIGLSVHPETRCGELPFGIRRQVELVRALAQRPGLLLLDEPAAGLDEEETVTLGFMLERARDDAGVTILLVEHDVDLVMQVCDWVHVLDFGRVLDSGAPDTVRNSPKVMAAYLGEEVPVAFA